MKCPRCGSDGLEKYHVDGAECASCEECGFDSCEELEFETGKKKSQKLKGSFSPYKKGGSLRTKK